MFCQTLEFEEIQDIAILPGCVLDTISISSAKLCYSWRKTKNLGQNDRKCDERKELDYSSC